jgi:hypothetical protein
MKLYPSYVVESRIRHRRRVASGVAGVLLLAVVGAVTLVVFEAEVPLSAVVPIPGCASDARSPAPACDRASLRPAG